MATGTVISLKGVKELPRRTPRTQRSTMDTVLLTPTAVDAWHRPPFQRPLRVNHKLLALVEVLKAEGGIVPGVITIGVLEGKKYLLDGQHRIEAFKLSELREGLADIRICHYDEMGDMADAFVELNSALVKLKADDTLRALESSSEPLQHLRKYCPYIGYDNIRRGTNTTILGMAQALRCWQGSMPDVPSSTSITAATLAKMLTDEDSRRLVTFMDLAYTAWGADKEYMRLWGGLNLMLCMWTYRRIMVSKWGPRTVLVGADQFRRCLMALSANTAYLDWLVGRTTGERDRSPAYARLRTLFASRIEADTGRKYYMPSPPWAPMSGNAVRLKTLQGDI